MSRRIGALAAGATDVMVGELRGERVTTSFEDAWSRGKELDPYLLELLPVLAQ